MVGTVECYIFWDATIELNHWPHYVGKSDGE